MGCEGVQALAFASVVTLTAMCLHLTPLGILTPLAFPVGREGRKYRYKNMYVSMWDITCDKSIAPLVLTGSHVVDALKYLEYMGFVNLRTT